MSVNKEVIEGLVNVRVSLIEKYNKLKDYKQNKNALMKEEDYAFFLHSTIVKIDKLLKGHVEFD
jgi:hypothetical protein